MRRIRPLLALLGAAVLGSPITPASAEGPRIVRAKLGDAVARAAELGVPLLVLHSDADPDVPIEPVLRLVAAAPPGTVRLERFADAGHTRLWNIDPRRFDRAIGGWLREL